MENSRDDQKRDFQELIGESNHIKELRQRITQAAKNNLSVLIQGPTGTGKELVAREIHFENMRIKKDKTKAEKKDCIKPPFIPIVCSSLSENLLESELFGHVKGAFTGAVHNKIGFLEKANGGTLFLDEIGDANIGIQAKLLRFAETQEFCPVGETKAKKVDVRLIAATNKNLKEEIKNKTFREDFYHRLTQFNIYTESLSERMEDVVILLHHFASKRESKIDPKVKFLLYAYDFPGNVRELKTLIECDYSYLKNELLKQWVSKINNKLEIDEFRFQICEKEILGLQSFDKSNVIEKVQEPLLKKYFKDNSDDAKSDYFKKLHSFGQMFSQLEAFLYPESYPEDCQLISEAYEILVLISNTDLSENEIANRIHIRREKLTNFEKYFGIKFPSKNDPLFDKKPLRIYPTLTGYWNRTKGKQHLPLSI